MALMKTTKLLLPMPLMMTEVSAARESETPERSVSRSARHAGRAIGSWAMEMATAMQVRRSPPLFWPPRRLCAAKSGTRRHAG